MNAMPARGADWMAERRIHEPAWEKLIDGDGALADCLSLSRVSISRATGDVRVRFQASRLLTRGEYKFVARRWRRRFRRCAWRQR